MKYQRIIECMLKLNPEPTDEQFHHLARAINVDIQELESVAYKMLGRHINKDIQLHAYAPDLNNLSIDDMALSGLLVENQTPDSSLMLNDGTVDTQDIADLQEVLNRDGSCEPYDQSGLIDDGAVLPRFPLSHRIKLVSAIAEKPKALDDVQHLLSKAGIKTNRYEPCHLAFRTKNARQDVTRILEALPRYRIRVNDDSILDKPNFAIKGRDGLVVQRLKDHLRIFFSEDK